MTARLLVIGFLVHGAFVGDFAAMILTDHLAVLATIVVALEKKSLVFVHRRFVLFTYLAPPSHDPLRTPEVCARLNADRFQRHTTVGVVDELLVFGRGASDRSVFLTAWATRHRTFTPAPCSPFVDRVRRDNVVDVFIA
jgi:hypothetical protein